MVFEAEHCHLNLNHDSLKQFIYEIWYDRQCHEMKPSLVDVQMMYEQFSDSLQMASDSSSNKFIE